MDIQKELTTGKGYSVFPIENIDIDGLEKGSVISNFDPGSIP
jgi:hypothetical protein